MAQYEFFPVDERARIISAARMLPGQHYGWHFWFGIGTSDGDEFATFHIRHKYGRWPFWSIHDAETGEYIRMVDRDMKDDLHEQARLHIKSLIRDDAPELAGA